jgi:hypothetical protein
MATMNKTIMTFLFCIAFLTLESNAQVRGQINTIQFEQFSVNDDISLFALRELGSDWDILKEALGNPAQEDCSEYDQILGFEPPCDFLYDGLKIAYANVGRGIELASVKLTNDTPFLQYEDTAIRVGDPISKLEPLFPEGYANRGPIHSPTGETNYAIRLNVASSIANFAFTYDPVNETVTEILFFQVLT